MSERAALAARLAPALLVLVLAATLLARTDAGLSLPSADTAAAEGMTAALDDLSEDPLVVVGFDPDLGTYAEIRPTLRALLADLLNRGATLAFVSLTPEGRALAVAELERMDRLEANPRQLIDIGFLPGAEAGLVALARGLNEGAGEGVISGLPGGEPLSEAEMALVVGGNDLGPRSWVEQVAPRTDAMALVAVAPAVLLPELQPYLPSGQLAALLATPRDGASYRSIAELGPLDRLVELDRGPSPLPVLVGLVAAIALLGQALGARAADLLRTVRSREAA